MTSQPISNTEDVLDSRDIIERIEELQEDRRVLGAIGSEAMDELAALSRLNNEAQDYSPDWPHGETLIRDSYFEEYAQELAEDCGMLDHKTEGPAYLGGSRRVAEMWPFTCIDWTQAARELQYDYTAVDFAGVTYWIRSC